MAAKTELETFVQKFQQLWKCGLDAHLEVESRAGQAWVGLHLRLGDEPGTVQTASNRKKSCSSPARDRRRARREAGRTLLSKTDLDRKLDAEEADEREVDLEKTCVHEPSENSLDEQTTDAVEATVAVGHTSDKNTSAEEAFENKKVTEKCDDVENTLDKNTDADEALKCEKVTEESNDVEREEKLEIRNVLENNEEILEPLDKNQDFKVTNEEVKDQIENNENSANVLKVVEPPSLVKVFATVVIANALESQETEADIGTLASILKCKDHLCRNILNTTYNHLRTYQLNSGKYWKLL